MGGESGEHEVSLASGAEVLAAMDRARWAPYVVRVQRDGAWCLPKSLDVSAPATCLDPAAGIQALLRQRPDVVFPVMHGPYGEDGRFQGLLDCLHLTYVGSGVSASALAMDKARARDVLRAAGLRVPDGEELRADSVATIGAPCVVKPMELGSSVGLEVVLSPERLAPALDEAFRHGDRVLVERYVQGTEVTAGVLERLDGALEALPLVEIRPTRSHFFDYEAKYTPGATAAITPARIPDALRDQVQALALAAHEALGCRDMSRTDVMVGADGAPLLLETNTIPGFTAQSLLPQAALAAGLDFAALVARLVDNAARRGAVHA